MMLGFPPPLFFQICWRFVSPAIIFVSSSAGLSLPAAPWQVSFSWQPAGGEREPLHLARAPPGGLPTHNSGHWESERGCREAGGDSEPPGHWHGLRTGA